MILTADLLHRFSLSAISIVELFVDPLNTFMPEYGVDSSLRRAHFLAQACFESGGFAKLQEDLRYTHIDRIKSVFKHRPAIVANASLYVFNPERLANAVYANEDGNGDEASGDGYRYRGRGLFQVTFRNNYTTIGEIIGVDLVAKPDALLEPVNAVKSALAFWRLNRCNDPADADNVPAVTKRINGPALEGLSDRSILKKRALDLKL